LSVKQLVRPAFVLLLAGCASPALAAGFGVEAATDLRRRGLGWSDGKPAIEAFGSLPIGSGFSIEAAAATLRQSPRHGGADLLVDGALRYTWTSDAWTVSGQVQGLGFIGASDQNYANLRATIARTIGPLQVQVATDWAPPQSAIGGSNLYFSGRASAGIPGTPITIGAGIGRSTGTDDGSGRSARLRPGGNYTDYRFDLDYIIGVVALGASLTTTSIDDSIGADDSGTRLLLRASLGF
jgi:hypothetical protein